MSIATARTTSEAEVRARIDDWAKATRAKDVDGIMASYAPDTRSFDCLSGEEHAGWVRVTACLRKVNGAWLIVHDHCSVPFDPESGKAMLDLAPEHTERASAA